MTMTTAVAAAPVITRKGSGLPSRVVFYGVEGIGKTTFGAFAPKPIFLMTRGETGLLTLLDNGLVPETDHFQEGLTWESLLDAVRYLIQQSRDNRTLVLDTLNGAERLCFEAVCEQRFEGSWESFGSYGRGAEAAQAEWNHFLVLLDTLRERRRMAVIALAHARVRTFKNPLGDDYDRYSPDMHEKLWGLAAKWSDIILFGTFEVVARKTKGETKAKAVNSQKAQRRVLHTVRTPGWDAKSRLPLPAQIEMGARPEEGWGRFFAAVQQARKPAEPSPSQEVAPPTNGSGSKPASAAMRSAIAERMAALALTGEAARRYLSNWGLETIDQGTDLQRREIFDDLCERAEHSQEQPAQAAPESGEAWPEGRE